ncbi:MAG TPA: peptidylprolyl isomerase [Pirellulales bacterium]|jgi:cyclophilin family peptidyl-prolyl cis-trans isomerase
MHFRVCLVILAAGVLAVAAPRVQAQDSSKKDASQDPVAAFEAVFSDWKKILAELKKNTAEDRAAKPDDREKLAEQRKEIFKRAEAMEPKIKKAAEDAYIAEPNKHKDVGAFLESIIVAAERKDKYEEALRVSNILIDKGYDNKSLPAVAGREAFWSNDFDTAAKDFKIAADAKTLDEKGQQLYEQVPEYQKKWARESEIRAAEAKADDLPRVKLKTSKGDIVVELFENEAPNTVANFISLVEAKKYDGTPFHRVIHGFVAQGGDPKGDGTGGPGYTIACECGRDDHREHFRGSMSMAHAGKDTGGSQFFLTFTPTAHLDGLHTVFGRIIEGLDVLSELQKRDPGAANPPEADKIIKATVVRKRDHKYEPVTLAK